MILDPQIFQIHEFFKSSRGSGNPRIFVFLVLAHKGPHERAADFFYQVALYHAIVRSNMHLFIYVYMYAHRL